MIGAMVEQRPINLEDLEPSELEVDWDKAKQTLKIYCEENDYRIQVVAFHARVTDGPFVGARLFPNEPNRPYALPVANGGIVWANVSLLSTEHPRIPGLMCPLVSACSCKMRPCEGHFDVLRREFHPEFYLEDLRFFDWKRVLRGEAILGRDVMPLPPVFAIFWDLEDDDADEPFEFHFDPHLD